MTKLSRPFCKPIWQRISFVVLVLGLSACIKTGDVKKETGSPEEAARVNFQLGAEYFKKNNLTLAYEKFKRSVEYDPTNAQSHAFLALVAEQLEQTDEARKHYLLALKIDENDPAVQNMYGAYLCKAGKVQKAEEYFLNAANNRFYSTPEAAYANAGHCFLKAENYTKALDYLNKALRINPNFQLALWYMANLHYNENRDLQAKAFLSRIGGAAVLPPEALMLGYKISQRSGELEQMREYSNNLKERYPDSLETTALLEMERNGG